VVWGRGTINLGRSLLAIDIQDGEVLAFAEDAFVPDPDGWTRAEPKQEDVMAVKFVQGSPKPPDRNVEGWLQKLANMRWNRKPYGE
jgi:hypothetical protein